MAADQKKWRVPQNAVTNNGRNCTIFGAQGDLGGPFDFSRFGLGVTSRDLSMALPVLQTFLCKCPLAPKLLGLE